jgi:hypothetical protein
LSTPKVNIIFVLQAMREVPNIKKSNKKEHSMLSLTQEHRQKLSFICSRVNMTKSAVIEMLIEKEYDYRMLEKRTNKAQFL